MLTDQVIEDNGLSRMPDQDWIQDGPTGALVRVRVTPNGRKNEIQGVFDQLLRIRLNAPPVDGKANQVLCDYLAEAWDLSRSAVVLIRGDRSRIKTLHIRGRSAADIRKRLGLCN